MPIRGMAIYSGALVLLAGVVGWTSGWLAERSPEVSAPVVLSHPPRHSQQRCAECHQEVVEAFRDAPHSGTLTRATAQEVRACFDGKTFMNPDNDSVLSYHVDSDRIAVSSSGYPGRPGFEWIFGSGTHARTPLLTFHTANGRTISAEHLVSWYPGDQLGITLGMENGTSGRGIHGLGGLKSTAETINCFGCHATFVPVQDDRILLDQIIPNVGCRRCHGDADQHVDDMDRGLSSGIERYSEMTPEESVDRCGECHRRATEMGSPLSPEDGLLVRFASVGLVQSPCFQQQREVKNPDGTFQRFDCISCHDPHRQASRDWKHHAAACLRCHDQANGRSVDCPVADRRDNCLECHMPQVPSNDYLSFTDHWIRVRSSAAPKGARPANEQRNE
ncbi:MAG: hypothetical protein KDA81_12280 [Planctomycetaceae bacterium]|nr:hypothetical protein [Planctomycetaceae bacterium]